MSIDYHVFLGVGIGALLGAAVVGVLFIALSYYKRRSYAAGYEAGVQLLDAFDVEDIRAFADVTTEGHAHDAHTRGLYQALEDNK